MDESIAEAVALLANDEHIDAATRSGVLARAFCIQLDQQSGSPIGERQEDSIYILGRKCAIGCEKRVYDDDCAAHHAEQIVEAAYLDDQIRLGDAIAAAIGDLPIETWPYILDIDLDCFRSWSAAQPKDPSALRRLVRGAVAITIATEPEFVDRGWLDEKDCDVDGLLKLLLGHIEAAAS